MYVAGMRPGSPRRRHYPTAATVPGHVRQPDQADRAGLYKKYGVVHRALYLHEWHRSLHRRLPLRWDYVARRPTRTARNARPAVTKRSDQDSLRRRRLDDRPDGHRTRRLHCRNGPQLDQARRLRRRWTGVSAGLWPWEPRPAHAEAPHAAGRSQTALGQGVIAMAYGPSPTSIGVPAVLVAVAMVRSRRSRGPGRSRRRRRSRA